MARTSSKSRMNYWKSFLVFRNSCGSSDFDGVAARDWSTQVNLNLSGSLHLCSYSACDLRRGIKCNRKTLRIEDSIRYL